MWQVPFLRPYLNVRLKRRAGVREASTRTVSLLLLHKTEAVTELKSGIDLYILAE
jgi:hypothetical protein